MSTALRPELEPLPWRMRALPVRRGYPVPWFVAYVNGDYDFRVVDARKHAIAVRERRCWVCGQVIVQSECAFVIGPMCAINRISSEPPSHVSCATWSAHYCPFLTRPQMARRDAGMPEGVTEPAGNMIARNPGVALVWVTRGFSVIQPPKGGVLYHVAEPENIIVFAEGRAATREELRRSIDTGYPSLMSVAEQEGPEAISDLEAAKHRALQLLKLEAA